MKIIKEVWKYWDAEGNNVWLLGFSNSHAMIVLFITSNYQGNQEIMEGCKEEGLHAFGTLWDF